jgi:hypothetical protein
VIGHLCQRGRAASVMPRELDHHPHAVFAARAEMHGAGAGKDAARTLGADLLRLGVCLRIPSDHVRIESSRGVI